jgi:hypothetical protein
MDIASIQTRIDELLAKEPENPWDTKLVYEVLEGALTLMGAVYGPESNQITSLREMAKSV